MRTGKIYKIYLDDELMETKYRLYEVMYILYELLPYRPNVVKVRNALNNDPHEYVEDNIRVVKETVELFCDICNTNMTCISAYNNHMATNIHLFRIKLKDYCESNDIEWTPDNIKKYSIKLYKQKYYLNNKERIKKKYIDNKNKSK